MAVNAILAQFPNLGIIPYVMVNCRIYGEVSRAEKEMASYPGGLQPASCLVRIRSFRDCKPHKQNIDFFISDSYSALNCRSFDVWHDILTTILTFCPEMVNWSSHIFVKAIRFCSMRSDRKLSRISSLREGRDQNIASALPFGSYKATLSY